MNYSTDLPDVFGVPVDDNWLLIKVNEYISRTEITTLVTEAPVYLALLPAP